MTVKRPGDSSGRRGFGIVLAIVVTLCVILFIAGVAELFFSSQVFSQAAHGAGGLTAEVLAESAVEELIYKIQADLNDPDSPIFREVRQALLLREPGLLDLGKHYKPEILIDAMKSSANKDYYKLFAIEKTSAWLRLRPLPNVGEAQMLTAEAAVRLTIGRRSEYRRVAVDRQVGIMLATPRRPLDQVPFAIAGTTFIADFRELAQKVDTAARAYDQTREMLEGWKSQVEGKPIGVPMTVTLPPLSLGGPGSQPVNVNLGADQQYVFGDGWETFPEPRLGDGLPADDSVIFAKPTEQVELADFQYYERLERQLGPLRRTLETISARFAGVMGLLAGAAASGELDSSAHSDWAAGMGSLGRDLRKLLDDMSREARLIGDHLKAHTAPGLTTDVIDTPRHYASSLPIMPLAYHLPGLAATMTMDSTSVVNSWPAISGHMAVYTPDGSTVSEPEYLFARPTYKGMVIISRPSGVDLGIGEFKADDPARDLLVIEADKIIMYKATVEAAVVARSALETRTDVRVLGSVILLRYGRPPAGDPVNPWTGKVSYNEALFSGVIRGPTDLSGLKLDRYVVSLNPRCSRKVVSWQP